MAAPMVFTKMSKFCKINCIFSRLSGLRSANFIRNGRLYCSTSSDTPSEKIPGKPAAGFAKEFEKIEEIVNLSSPTKDTTPKDFESMLRDSPLFQLGDVDGKVVQGKIIDIVGDDLYIDFGGKFHCVCKRPRNRSSEYFRGSTVRIRLHNMELSRPFMGSDKHITLLEAEATLIGLHRPASLQSS